MRGHVAGDTLSLYLSRLEQPQTSTPLAGRAGSECHTDCYGARETRKFKLPPRRGSDSIGASAYAPTPAPGHLASGSNAARLGAQGMPAIWLRNRPDATR